MVHPVPTPPRFLSCPQLLVHRDGQPANEDRRALVDTRKRITPIRPLPGRGCGCTTTGRAPRRSAARKAELWRAVGSIRGMPKRARWPSRAIPVRDETLAAYAPAVRVALASRGYARP